LGVVQSLSMLVLLLNNFGKKNEQAYTAVQSRYTNACKGEFWRNIRLYSSSEFGKEANQCVAWKLMKTMLQAESCPLNLYV